MYNITILDLDTGQTLLDHICTAACGGIQVDNGETHSYAALSDSPTESALSALACMDAVDSMLEDDDVYEEFSAFLSTEEEPL